MATLRTNDGIWCREFDVLHGGRPGGRSLACRGNDGAWLVPVPGVLQPKEYGVAGGSAQGQSPPIDLGKAVLEGAKKVLSGTAVGRDKELDLIGQRWRETP